MRAFFAPCRPPIFDLARLDEFPGAVVYAAPEPDDELRETMRALWALFPDYPPHGRAAAIHHPTPFSRWAN